MVGPPEPNTEASQKQTYVPGQDFYKLKTFTSEVKVVPLTYYEELLVRNRAMYPSVIRVHYLYVVFLVKTAPLFRAEKHRVWPQILRHYCKLQRHLSVVFVVNRAVF